MGKLLKRYSCKICPNGHTLYWESKYQISNKFCDKCGKPYIENCPTCQKSLVYTFTGRQSALDGSLLPSFKLPNFCNDCGVLLPWTKTKHEEFEDSGFWSLLHTKVITVAKQRFESGNYSDAVLSAFRELENTVKNIAGNQVSEDLSGRKLMREVFNRNAPIIQLDGLETVSGKNVQEGLEHIFAGAIQAIRNPIAHENVKLNVTDACHQLMLASFLFSKIDKRVKPERNVS